MPIPNDTYPILLPTDLLHSVHLVLLDRDGPLIPQQRQRPAPKRRRIDNTSPGYRIAATNARLRTAVNLAIACLRTGRTKEALDTLENA